MAAPMVAAQVGTSAIEHADTLAHVGFTGVGRIVQAIVIFLCVIIILIGIIVMSVGNFTTGLIWFAIGVIAIGGTIFWIRGSSGFYSPGAQRPAYQPGTVYNVAPRSAYRQPQIPLSQLRPAQPHQGHQRRFMGRGEVKAAMELTDEELRELTPVGGDDCNCGGADNVIDRLVSPRDVKGAGESGELFDEAMLKDVIRDGVSHPRKPLTLRA
jgi:hypothetical protein